MVMPLLVAACGDDAAGDGGDSGAGSAGAGGAGAAGGAGGAGGMGAGGAGAGGEAGQGGAPVEPWTSAGFGAPLAWALDPAVGDFWHDYTCPAGNTYWADLWDFDGDGTEDVLLYRDDCAGTGASAGNWLVYPSGPGGMGQPLAWSAPVLPNGAAPEWAQVIEQCSASGFFQTTALDIHGDGWLDLVVVQDDCYGAKPAAGVLVYAGSPTGFADMPQLWDAPGATGAAAGGFQLTAYNGPLRYQTLDVTADGRPDVVVTRDDATPGVGTDHWLVYPNDGSGWSPTAIEWALPAPPLGAPAWEVTFGGECQDGGFSAELRDLDGDGALDLVLKWSDCGGVTQPSGEWRVYRGGAAGFAATADTWTLPALVAGIDCGFGDFFEWELRDMDGDARPDIVVARDECSGTGAATGHSSWRAFRNLGDGFASSGIEWALPPHPGYGFAFEHFQHSSACGFGGKSIGWTTREMTGDGVVDLVLRQDDCDAADPTLGRSHWRVYPGAVDAP
jgi:hypothetical protein